MKAISIREYQDSFEQWGFQNAIEFKNSLQQTRGMEIGIFLRKYAFFGTMTFDETEMRAIKKLHGRPYTDTSFEMDQFHRFYNETRRALERRKGRGIPSPAPLAVVGVDFNGTRRNRSIPDHAENLHLHWIVIVAPDDLDHASKLFASLPFRYHFRQATIVDGIECVPFDPSRKSFRSLVGYALKGDAVLQGEWGPDTVRRYPSQDYRMVHSYVGKTAEQRQLETLLGALRSARSESRNLPPWEPWTTRENSREPNPDYPELDL